MAKVQESWSLLHRAVKTDLIKKEDPTRIQSGALGPSPMS